MSCCSCVYASVCVCLRVCVDHVWSTNFEITHEWLSISKQMSYESSTLLLAI